MPNLLERTRADAARILFNEAELGAWHRINDTPLLLIVDNDALRERVDIHAVAGVHLGRVLFFAKAEDFPERPEEGQPMVYDGQPMYVSTCNEDFGLYEITLSQERLGAMG